MIVTNNLSATNTTGSGRSQHKYIYFTLVLSPLNTLLTILDFMDLPFYRFRSSNEPDIWLEVGSISLGPLIVEAAVSLSNADHNLHLVQHR